MDIQQSIKTCLKKFATFDGRASRSEYWWFQFFYILVVIVAVILDGVLVGGASLQPQSFARIANYKS